jgi:hypothetical protein
VNTLLRWFVAIVAVTAIAAHVSIHVARPELEPITSDGFDYYVYLPDWFLFHDTSLQAVADDCCGGRFPEWTAMTRSPQTGRWINAHPIGVAVLVAPFFGLAHALTRWTGLPPDGFSLYYQHGAALAGLSFMLAGLAILRALLRRQSSDGVALATLTALTFGTNLFHYGTFDATYSHAFSFALVCALMALADGWWDAPTVRRTAALGAVVGLLILVRHPNIVLLALVPLVGLGGRTGLRTRAAQLGTLRWHLLGAVLLAAVIVLPQVLLYRAATGAWFANPYAGAGGTFTNLSSPRVAHVLFSAQKGLFFWSPVLLLAIPGVFSPGAWARDWRAGALSVLAVQTYLLASWHDWQLGGSFGHRGFTDLLGLFTPFLAATFTRTAAGPRWAKSAVALLAAAAIALSVFQMLQYWRGILPIADTSLEQYGKVFLRWH